jgi:hypothetical protein
MHIKMRLINILRIKKTNMCFTFNIIKLHLVKINNTSMLLWKFIVIYIYIKYNNIGTEKEKEREKGFDIQNNLSMSLTRRINTSYWSYTTCVLIVLKLILAVVFSLLYNNSNIYLFIISCFNENLCLYILLFCCCIIYIYCIYIYIYI